MLTYPIAVALFVGAAVLVFLWLRSRHTYTIIDGSSWLSGLEKIKLLNRFRKSGLLVDGRRRISPSLSYRHMAVIAPSGTGKSVNIICPNVLALNRGSAVITDLSGEIFQATAGKKADDEFRIAVLDVTDTNRSLSFNALHRANTHTEINKVAESLIVSAFPEQNASNKFWNDSAESTISILIRCLKRGDDKFANLPNLFFLLNNFGADGSGLDDFVRTYADEITFAEFLGIRSNSPRAFASIIATARTALKAFGDPKLSEISGSDTIAFESLRARKTILYLVVPEHEIRFYSGWLNLVYTQIFNFCMQTEKKGESYLPISFLIDEAGNTKIPGFATYASTIRKKKCSITLALQDVMQLTTLYGHAGASAILNGSISTRIYLPGCSLETCQDLERILGKQTLEDPETGQRFQESLMTADEIRTMPDGTGIMISGSSLPAQIRLTPYFKRRDFRRFSKIPPPEIKGSENSVPEYINLRSLPGTHGSDVIQTSGNGKDSLAPALRTTKDGINSS